MPALIHTTLGSNTYKVLHDSGAVKDAENLFVMRKRKILYHGSEESLINAFREGAKTSPSGGSYMLCSGPMSAELCDGTRYDPHWEAEVNWVGIHSAYYGSADFVYRLIFNYARTETSYPISSPRKEGDTGGDVITVAMPPIVLNSPFNDINGYKRVRMIHFVPMIQVVGVIMNPGHFPVSIYTPKIEALILNLNGTHPPPPGSLHNWDVLPDPQHNYAPYFLPANNQQGTNGRYVPASLSSHRHLSFGDVHAFTLDLTWEQGLTP